AVASVTIARSTSDGWPTNLRRTRSVSSPTTNLRTACSDSFQPGGRGPSSASASRASSSAYSTSAGGRCGFASFVSTAWLSLFVFATIFLSATKRLEVAHQLAEHDGIEPAEHQVATSFPPAAAALDGDLAERLLRILRHHADDDARVERQLRLRAVGQRLFE